VSRAVVKRPRAVADLIGCYAYLGEKASDATADRFLTAVEKTLGLLARSPGIGAPYETNNPHLTGLRSVSVSRFKSFILFYQVFDDRIELVRVLHGARDTRTILEGEGKDEE
jgi:toxin ParE1/3/4